MSSWLTYFWQANFCLVVFFLGYRLWLRKEQCFNYKRLYLIAAGVLSLTIPLLRFDTIKLWYSDSLAALPLSLELPALVKVPGVSNEWYLTIVLGIYALICFILGGILVIRIYQTLRLVRSCQIHQTNYHGYPVYLTNGQLPTSSYFNYLLWDNSRDIDELQKKLVLDHEIVHIREGHSYDLMFFELLKIFFWFNPVAWLLLKAIRKLHEFIADTRVVTDSNKPQYIKYLAEQTLNVSNVPWAHYFNQNLTLNRIKTHHSNLEIWNNCWYIPGTANTRVVCR